MFTSRFLPCSIILLSFFFSSCSDTSSPDISSNIDIIPLKKGNTWHYRMTGYDSTGSYSYPDESSIIINDTIIFNNQTWYSYNDIPSGFWYTNKSDGYWVLFRSADGKSGNDTTLLLYKYPTFPGDAYGEIKVISINEELELPIGNFKVIHYSHDFEISDNPLLGSFHTYVASGIGVVKIMQLGKRSDGSSFKVYERELKGFSLAE
jgi:hypothetical protein